MQGIVAAVAAKEGIVPAAIKAVEGGLSHKVFFVNDDLVFRVSFSGAKSFEHERDVLQALEGVVPVAETIAVGEVQFLNDTYGYSIVRRLNGQPLSRVWLAASRDERREYMRQLRGLMEKLHTVTAVDVDFLPSGAGFIEERHTTITDWIGKARDNDMPEDVLLQLEHWYADHFYLLDNETTRTFVHSDLHFENVFVEEEGGLVLLDFEWSCLAPPSYDFVPILSFALEPRAYLHEATRKLYSEEPLHEVAALFLPEDAERIDLWKTYLVESVLWAWAEDASWMLENSEYQMFVRKQSLVLFDRLFTQDLLRQWLLQ